MDQGKDSNAVKQKALILVFFAGLLFTACAATQTTNSQSNPAAPSSSVAMPEPTPEKVKTVRFSASGDNLIHGSIYLQAQRRTQDGSYDFAPLYAEIAPFFKGYDLNMITF